MLVGHLANLLLVCAPGAGRMLGAVNREKDTLADELRAAINFTAPARPNQAVDSARYR